MPGTFLYDLAVNNPTSNKKSQLCLTEHVHKIEFSEREHPFPFAQYPGTHREYTHQYEHDKLLNQRLLSSVCGR